MPRRETAMPGNRTPPAARARFYYHPFHISSTRRPLHPAPAGHGLCRIARNPVRRGEYHHTPSYNAPIRASA